VSSPEIVEPFDVIEHIRSGLIPGPVDLPTGPLGLEDREKAFHRSIVPAKQVRPAEASCSRGDYTPLGIEYFSGLPADQKVGSGGRSVKLDHS